MSGDKKRFIAAVHNARTGAMCRNRQVIGICHAKLFVRYDDTARMYR